MIRPHWLAEMSMLQANLQGWKDRAANLEDNLKACRAERAELMVELRNVLGALDGVLGHYGIKMSGGYLISRTAIVHHARALLEKLDRRPE